MVSGINAYLAQQMPVRNMSKTALTKAVGDDPPDDLLGISVFFPFGTARPRFWGAHYTLPGTRYALRIYIPDFSSGATK